MANRNLIVRAGFDASGFSRGVRQATNSLNGFSTTATSALSKVGKAALAFISIKAIAGFVKDCLSLGSAVVEVQNVVDVAFGDMAEEVNQFAKTSITQLGISETACKRFTGVMGQMLKTSGVKKGFTEMSINLTKLSADLASFYDIDAEEAFTKIRAGMSGEVMPLKQLGISMNVANLQAYALSQGITKSFDKMSQGEKTILRYNYLMSVTKDVQGDFQRTSGSWANQTRILNEQFKALKTTLGQAFIQMLTPVLKALNMLMAKLQSVANYFNAFTEAAFGKQQAAQGAGMAKSTEDAADAMDNLGDATETAGKKATKATAGFDEVNTLTKATSADDIADKLNVDDVNLNKLPTDKPTKDAEKLKDTLDKVAQKLKPVADLGKDMWSNFKGGLIPPIKDVNWKSILDGLNRIKKALKDIASDPGLQNAFKNMATSFANMAGKLVGNTIKLGANIADGLINGIADGLEAKKQTIIDRLTDTFNNMTRINVSLGNIFDFVGDISKVFTEDNARSIWSSITQILVDTCTTGIDLATKIVADLVEGIENILLSNKARIYDAFNGNLGVAAQVLNTVKDAVEQTCQKILDVYDQKVSPAIKNVSDALADFGGCCLDLYNNWVLPALSSIADKVDECFKKHLQPQTDEAIDLLGQLAESVGNLLKYWEPLFEFLANVLVPFLSGAFKTVMDAVIDIINIIIDVIKDIIRVLKGVLQFLEGVFTLNWQKAWEGIQNILGGAWDVIKDVALGALKTIWDFLKNVVSSVKDLINGLKQALGLMDKSNAQNNLNNFKAEQDTNGNTDRFKKWNNQKRKDYIDKAIAEGRAPEEAREWIMNLPHYASGGIIDREQLAVLGEGGRKEAVVPLENSGFIDSLAISIANAINANRGSSTTGGMLNASINVDGREIARATVPYMNEEARRTGVRLNG